MKRFLLIFAISLFGVFGLAAAQVASAEFQGVDATAPKSPEASATLRDESVGETSVLVRALDAEGNPVAGATISWTVINSTGETVYVVGSSASMDELLEQVDGEAELMLEGGVTDENGEAYLIIDSATAGDASVAVTVDDVAGETYSGGNMRVVWF